MRWQARFAEARRRRPAQRCLRLAACLAAMTAHRRDPTAIHGFVAWIAIHIAFTIFVLWAYTPEHILIGLGVTYFPAKHWALALPCWALVSLVAGVLLYATYNAMHRPDLESLSNIVDEYTRVPDERELSGALRHNFFILCARPGRVAC